MSIEKDILKEHLDIVNNQSTFESIIREQWETPDDFWYVCIDSRVKDFISRKVFHPYYIRKKPRSVKMFHKIGDVDKRFHYDRKHNTVGYVIIKGDTVDDAINSLKNPIVHFLPWAQEKVKRETYSSNDGKMKAIIKTCNHFFARAYVSINKRSFSYCEKNSNGDEATFRSIALKSYTKFPWNQNPKNGKLPWQMIDCDIDTVEGQKKMEDYLAKNYDFDISINSASHDGRHYIIKNPLPGNKTVHFPDELGQDKSDTSKDGHPILVKKDGFILLYSPCGAHMDYGNFDANDANDIERFKNSDVSQYSSSYKLDEKDLSEIKINRNDISYMVSECIKYLINEIELNMRDNNKIGSKGSLSQSDLLDTSQLFGETMKKIKTYNKELRKGLDISLDEYFKDDDGYKIWRNYVKSMTGVDEMVPLTTKTGRIKKGKNGNPIMVPKLDSVKKIKVRDEQGNVVFGPDGKPTFEEYPKSAIKFTFWVENMTQSKKLQELGGLESKIYAYEFNGSYLFGYFDSLGAYCDRPVFIANSFSCKDGQPMQIIKSICEYDNIVFSVSMDLAAMLIKLGLYYKPNSEHETYFGGRMVKKLTLATSKDIVDMAALADSMSLGFKKR